MVYDPYPISPFLHEISAVRDLQVLLRFGLAFILPRGIFKLQINCVFIDSGRFCQRRGTSFVFPEKPGTLIMEFISVS